jgi:hypothetical protein
MHLASYRPFLAIFLVKRFLRFFSIEVQIFGRWGVGYQACRLPSASKRWTVVTATPARAANSVGERTSPACNSVLAVRHFSSAGRARSRNSSAPDSDSVATAARNLRIARSVRPGRCRSLGRRNRERRPRSTHLRRRLGLIPKRRATVANGQTRFGFACKALSIHERRSIILHTAGEFRRRSKNRRRLRFLADRFTAYY